MTTVFKVVRHRDDGDLVSVYVKDRKAITLYAAGKPSLARNGMKLLAFDHRTNAERFAKRECEQIWKAEAKNVTPQLRLEFLHMTWESFKAFWEGSVYNSDPAPPGTVACDSITLIKRVDNGEDK